MILFILNGDEGIAPIIGSFFTIILHHRVHHFLTLLFQLLPLVLSLLVLAFLIKSSKQQFPLFSFLHLSNPRVGVVICPLYGQDFVAVKSLVGHRLLCELCHASMSVLDESEAFVREDVDIFEITPESEMPQEDFVKLSHSVIVVRESVVTDVECFCFFGERANTLHVLSKDAEPRPSENILGLVHILAILNGRYFMVKLAVDSIGAASPRKEETKVGSSLLIEQICSSIPDIQLWVALGQGCLLIFFILGADVLAEPKVVLLISFLVCVIVGQTGLHLFAGRSLHGISEGNVLLLFLLYEFLRDMLVDIVSWVGVVLERSEVGLNPIVKFLWQLPN